MHQPPPTDNLLRAVCCSCMFMALGFLGHPNGLWGDLFRLASGHRPPLDSIVGSAVAFAMVSWFLGAAVEPALIALGLRLTHPPEQAADYDDSGPHNP